MLTNDFFFIIAFIVDQITDCIEEILFIFFVVHFEHVWHKVIFNKSSKKLHDSRSSSALIPNDVNLATFVMNEAQIVAELRGLPQ